MDLAVAEANSCQLTIRSSPETQQHYAAVESARAKAAELAARVKQPPEPPPKAMPRPAVPWGLNPVVPPADRVKQPPEPKAKVPAVKAIPKHLLREEPSSVAPVAEEPPLPPPASPPLGTALCSMGQYDYYPAETVPSAPDQPWEPEETYARPATVEVPGDASLSVGPRVLPERLSESWTTFGDPPASSVAPAPPLPSAQYSQAAATPVPLDAELDAMD